MLSNKKEFSKEKRKLLKKLFDICDFDNQYKKNIKKLKFSEENNKKITIINSKLDGINKTKNNETLIILINNIFEENESVDRYYKLLDSKNFINNDNNNDRYIMKKYCRDLNSYVLLYINGKGVDNKIKDYYFKLINNSDFLNNKKFDTSYSFDRKNFLKLLHFLQNKKSAKELYEIGSNPDFWKTYNELGKYRIMEELKENINNDKILELLKVLINKKYFKDKYNDIRKEILKIAHKCNKYNIYGVISVINSTKAKDFEKNKIQMFELLNKIKDIKNTKEALTYANIVTNKKFIGNILNSTTTSKEVEDRIEALNILNYINNIEGKRTEIDDFEEIYDEINNSDEKIYTKKIGRR